MIEIVWILAVYLTLGVVVAVTLAGTLKLLDAFGYPQDEIAALVRGRSMKFVLVTTTLAWPVAVGDLMSGRYLR